MPKVAEIAGVADVYESRNVQAPPALELLGTDEVRVASWVELSNYLVDVASTPSDMAPARAALVFDMLNVADDFSDSSHGYKLGQWRVMHKGYECYGGRWHKELYDYPDDAEELGVYRGVDVCELWVPISVPWALS